MENLEFADQEKAYGWPIWGKNYPHDYYKHAENGGLTVLGRSKRSNFDN